MIGERLLDCPAGVLVEHADRRAEVVQRIAELGPDELIQWIDPLRRECCMQQMGNLGPDAEIERNDRDAQAERTAIGHRFVERGEQRSIGMRCVTGGLCVSNSYPRI